MMRIIYRIKYAGKDKLPQYMNKTDNIFRILLPSTQRPLAEFPYIPLSFIPLSFHHLFFFFRLSSCFLCGYFSSRLQMSGWRELWRLAWWNFWFSEVLCLLVVDYYCCCYYLFHYYHCRKYYLYIHNHSCQLNFPLRNRKK